MNNDATLSYWQLLLVGALPALFALLGLLAQAIITAHTEDRRISALGPERDHQVTLATNASTAAETAARLAHRRTVRESYRADRKAAHGALLTALRAAHDAAQAHVTYWLDNGRRLPLGVVPLTLADRRAVVAPLYDVTLVASDAAMSAADAAVHAAVAALDDLIMVEDDDLLVMEPHAGWERTMTEHLTKLGASRQRYLTAARADIDVTE